jgi:hypothetical protein
MLHQIKILFVRAYSIVPLSSSPFTLQYSLTSQPSRPNDMSGLSFNVKSQQSSATILGLKTGLLDLGLGKFHNA